MNESSTPNDCRLIPFIDLFDLHTGVFRKAIDGISDGDAHKRLDTEANHIAWIAGSVVQSRIEGARRQGLTVTSAGDALLSGHQGIQGEARYPSLQQYLADWDAVSPLLREKTLELDTAWLDSRRDMGGWEASNYEVLMFMTYREASMIGQLALWRRLLGYPAISYM